MNELQDRVAVVTGGASGIGRAMAECFAGEQMKVVVADINQDDLDQVVLALTEDGHRAVGVATDVTDPDSLEQLAERAYETYGAVHVLCNNAGVGASSEGWMWEHQLSDWNWLIGVNVLGIVHGLNAFLPRMVAAGSPGHVVNTSSGNGGIAPYPTSVIYPTTKAAVVTLTECLYAQLEDAGTDIGASVLFPGPHMLRTGLWESYRNRPAAFAPERPRSTPRRNIEQYEEAMRAAGLPIHYTPPEQVADDVVAAIRENRFWILPESERTDEAIRKRSASMLARANPDYLQRFVLGTTTGNRR